MRPQVAWKFKDLCGVTLIAFGVAFLVRIAAGLFLNNERVLMYLFSYSGGLSILFLPILWIKIFYKQKIAVLGIQRGRWSSKHITIIAVGVVVGYYFLISNTFGPGLKIDFLTKNIWYIILVPLSAFGVQRVLIAPMGEEVFFRGFLYGYLRNRVGVKMGLFLQSLMFGLVHLDYASDTSALSIFLKLLIGLLFGILYQVSDSLYPSMLCHALINFLSLIITAQQSLAS